MTKNLNEQNQKQIENQIQKDLSALNKLEKWIKNVQDRIETNRRKLVKMKTTQMNHNLIEKTKNDSAIISQSLKFELIETSTSCQKTNINPNNNSVETNSRTKSLKEIEHMDIKPEKFDTVMEPKVREYEKNLSGLETLNLSHNNLLKPNLKPDEIKLEEIIEKLIQKRLVPLVDKFKTLDTRVDKIDERMDKIDEILAKLKGDIYQVKSDTEKIQKTIINNHLASMNGINTILATLSKNEH